MVAAALLIIWMLIETSAGIFASVYAIPVKPDIVFDLSLSLILLFVLPLVTSVFPFLRYNYSSPITSLRSVNAGGNSIVSRAVFLFIQSDSSRIVFCSPVVHNAECGFRISGKEYHFMPVPVIRDTKQKICK